PALRPRGDARHRLTLTGRAVGAHLPRTPRRRSHERRPGLERSGPLVSAPEPRRRRREDASALLLAGGACGRAVLLLAGDVGLEAGGLAPQLAQVVELGAAAAAAAHDRDLADQRRVEREDALDALAEGDLAHGHGAAGAAAVLARDDDALEGMGAGPVALGDIVVDTDCVHGHRLEECRLGY